MFNLFHLLQSFSSKDIGLDMGTSNTLIYVRGKGVVLCEPSVVAVAEGTGQVMAVGEEAKKMLGKTHESIRAVKPLKHGVIADFETTKSMLRHFIRKVHGNGFFNPRPKVIVAVPSDQNEVERRAVEDSLTHAGAREVHLVRISLVAAIGAGLPVHEASGYMIVDIGGGLTEVAIISLSGIVQNETIRVGGSNIDEAISLYLKKTYNLMIGERTAEEIKIRIGSAYPFEETKTMEVRGRDIITGLPVTRTVNSDEIREAIAEPIAGIVDTVRQALERCPAELSSDLVTRGIVLLGGGALLRGIDNLLAEETGLPVAMAEAPLSVAALGAGKIIEKRDLLDDVEIYKKKK